MRPGEIHAEFADSKHRIGDEQQRCPNRRQRGKTPFYNEGLDNRLSRHGNNRQTVKHHGKKQMLGETTPDNRQHHPKRKMKTPVGKWRPSATSATHEIASAAMIARRYRGDSSLGKIAVTMHNNTVGSVCNAG